MAEGMTQQLTYLFKTRTIFFAQEETGVCFPRKKAFFSESVGTICACTRHADACILARMEWNDRFMMLFREATERYLMNTRTPVERFFLPEECDFLASIGQQPAELHAFIQDYAMQGEPSPSSALLIAATRRAFFLTAQRGISGNAAPVKAASLPPETEEFQEIPYLPRIIRKAEAKLFGTLDPAVMYPDAKDRNFLRENGNIHPNDFLQLVWNTRSDRQKIITAVLHAIQQQESGSSAPAEPQPAATPAPAPQADAAADSAPRQTELNLG